jgi:hypothetical protein
MSLSIHQPSNSKNALKSHNLQHATFYSQLCQMYLGTLLFMKDSSISGAHKTQTQNTIQHRKIKTIKNHEC